MTDLSPNLTQRIGQRLRAARHDAGLSLVQLAERTGGAYSKSRISNYEQGTRRLSLEGAIALADAVGNCSPIWLLCLDEAAWPADSQLLECYRRADEAGRARLLALAGEVSGG